MVTLSTLKTLKKQDGPVSPRDPREKPVPVRSGGLTDRVQAWWQSIWRRRWLSVITAWLICVAGWSVITLWPTSFVASAVIYADLAELAGKTSSVSPSEQTPAVMLKSLLLSDEGLDDVRNNVALDPQGGQSLRDDIMLRSTVPPVFVLAYEHKSPDTAKQVLEALIAGYRKRLNQASKASLARTKALEEQISDHEGRLQAAEADLAAFKRTNADYLQDNSSQQAELALLQEELASLEERVKATTVDRDDIAVKLAKVRDADVDAAEVEAPRSLDQLLSERQALETELAKLQERYADTHPYVVAVFDTIKNLDAETLALREVADDDMPSNEEAPVDREELEQRHGELIVEVSALNSRFRDKRREIERLQALTRTVTSVEADLTELEAEKQELETALSDLQQSRDELQGDIGGEATQEAFRLIKQPELPTDPVGPSRMMALAAVLFGGTGLGAAVAVFCNRLKGVFESAWQLKKRFDVGVLGTISEVMTPAERKRLGYSRLTFGLAYLALLGAFGSLVAAEMTDKLAPLGEQLRAQILG